MADTGRFRMDVIAAGMRAARDAAPAADEAGAPDDGTPYAAWLERMERSRSRHAAITKNLYSWSNYKNWADKVRENWEPGSENPQPPRKGR